MSDRKYEAMLILDPVLSEDKQKETLDKLDEVIKKYGGTPDRREVVGKRRLAFQINKRRDGNYILVYFDSNPSAKLFDEVDRFCRYSEEILRHIVVKAVVGKSKGDPSKAPEERPRFSGPRPPRPPMTPREDAPAADAPAKEASEGGAVATATEEAKPESSDESK